MPDDVNNADQSRKRDQLMWALHRSSLLGLLAGGVVMAAWMAQGRANFGDLFGIGLVYAAGIGLFCAVSHGGTEPTFADPMSARNHWRGHLQMAGAIMAFAAVGGIVSAVIG